MGRSEETSDGLRPPARVRRVRAAPLGTLRGAPVRGLAHPWGPRRVPGVAVRVPGREVSGEIEDSDDDRQEHDMVSNLDPWRTPSHVWMTSDDLTGIVPSPDSILVLS